jgi:hypothetical protein
VGQFFPCVDDSPSNHFNMKNLLLLSILLCGLVACNQNPSSANAENTPADAEPTDNLGSQDHPDLVAINDVIHGFYAWYDEFQKDETRNINFTNDKGKHLKLDEAKLNQYFSNIKNSGFISDDFIVSEKATLKKCEQAWQQEEIGDVPSCMDGDRYFCAQDWDIEFWTTAPIGADGLDTDKSVATMSGMEAGSPREQKFELKKENGKWLISKIYCDYGPQ